MTIEWTRERGTLMSLADPLVSALICLPVFEVRCGLCQRPAFTVSQADVPTPEEQMAALARHWLRAHPSGCPWCWRMLPATENARGHREACRSRFEARWRTRWEGPALLAEPPRRLEPAAEADVVQFPNGVA
jgi:hypothetical protein